jgi:O-methyltransferase
LRAAGRELLPAASPDLMTAIIRNDSRSEIYFRAIEYVNFEQVPGDIVELGVFGGLSLALFAKGVTFDPAGPARRIIGIDSFEGLPPATEAHARWQTGDCASMHAWHPLVRVGDPISIDTTRELFARCALAPPVLYQGLFAEVLPRVVPSDIQSIAVLHVDCDLYESTRDALEGTAPALQDGAMVLFDDWFHYKGRPDRGEARAFGEFLARHPEWQAVPWRVYGTFCQAFILVRR